MKAAAAGISLSEAEASVASPFTSKDPTVRCVLDLVAEGRAGLVTALNTFRFMALYSLTQCLSVLILYSLALDLSDKQYLYIDLILVTLPSICMGMTRAEQELSPRRPITRLLSFVPIFSILFAISLIALSHVYMFLWCQQMDWYVSHNDILNGKNLVKQNHYRSYENGVNFLHGNFHYTTLLVLVSSGRPFRRPLYTNSLLIIFLGSTLLANIWILYGVHTYIPWLQWLSWLDQVSWFDLQRPPSPVSLSYMLLVALLVFFISYIVQDYVLNTEFVTQKSEEITNFLWLRIFGSSRHRQQRKTRIAPTAIKKEGEPLEQLLTVNSPMHTVGSEPNNPSSQSERSNQMKGQIVLKPNENEANSQALHTK